MPDSRLPFVRRRTSLWWLVAAAFLGVVALVLAVASFLIDWLWMGELGYRSVFWRVLGIKASLIAAAFIPLFAYFWVNLRFATGTVAAWKAGGEVSRIPPISTLVQSPFARLIQAIAAFVLALALAAGFTAAWEDAVLFLFAGAFGVAEPVFGNDAGFYMFRLPIIDGIQNLVQSAAVLGLVFHGGVLYAYGVPWRWQTLDEAARRRSLVPVCANGSLFLAAWGAGYLLDRYQLLHTSGGTVAGAGYTDIHVLIPALLLMAAAAMAAIAALAFAGWTGRARPALFGIGGLAILHVLALWLAPLFVQSYIVDPNELEAEEPYIARNIDFTRRGFGIDKVVERDYPASTDLTMADIEEHRQTIRNIRLWDYRPLLRTFQQIQEIRLYYQFYDIDVDRYELESGVRQVMLSARELTPTLPERADTWLNRRLQYTHGYGLAMSLASQEGGQGTPTLILKDLPTVASRGIKTGNVAIYYGEQMQGYRIVSTGLRELHYPKGDENVYTYYKGDGGILIDSFWKRLLFAAEYFDINILLSGYIKDDSRIQIRRRVQDRIRAIAPFLRLDRDPYLVLNDGQLVWIQDAYTVSERFPYSDAYEPTNDLLVERQGRGPDAFTEAINYIRNSVKVVVDAIDGDVGFHVIDDKDPVLAAYRRAFPALFKPLEAMPPGLKAHLRYPQDLFEVQAERYRIYHMQRPQVFYNKEDQWDLPREKYAGSPAPVEPYYILVRLPGEERLQFLLITPYTPSNRDNLIAWMAARSDYPGYGELVVFKLPKERLIFGPMQMEALIDQDTVISRQLTLWDQRGSMVIRGNLLVIPIEQSLLYVEPVYLVAEENNLPQLKRVIVGYGDKVAMRPTLDEALSVIFGGAERKVPPVAGAQPRQIQDRLSKGAELIDKAEQGLARGDWASFGEAMERLKELLSSAAEGMPAGPEDTAGGS